MAMKENRRRRIFNRLSKAFWILEILELILAILILAFTGSASQGFTRDLRYPTVPGKLVYNVFIAAFTMVSLAIMIPLDVWRPQTWGRWNMIFMPWPRVAVNVVFVVTWAGAIGSAFYTCGELCSAAESNFGCLTYATLSCDCSLRAFGICDLTRRVYFEQRSYRYEATQALDALIFATFLFSTGLLVGFHWVRESRGVVGHDLGPVRGAVENSVGQVAGGGGDGTN